MRRKRRKISTFAHLSWNIYDHWNILKCANIFKGWYTLKPFSILTRLFVWVFILLLCFLKKAYPEMRIYIKYYFYEFPLFCKTFRRTVHVHWYYSFENPVTQWLFVSYSRVRSKRSEKVHSPQFWQNTKCRYIQCRDRGTNKLDESLIL